ncbi:MAG: hypothetical protein IJY72_05050, partial [Akkermansia sp.]|nr:hypothetical protein [Akkermansia sp.]
MGKLENDKYTSDADRVSQVRNIINQLNTDRPSHEKSREVVVRPDGTKCVRVVKKRRVVKSREEQNKRARRNFVLGLLGVVLLVLCLAGAFMFRVSQFSTEDYYKALEQKITPAFGAQQVQLVGARLNGYELSVDNVLVEMPEAGIVRHVEMSGLKGSLGTTSFFTGVLKIAELNIERATVQLAANAQTLEIPAWNGEKLWDIARVECADFSCYAGDEGSGPLAIKNTQAYMYRPGRASLARVLVMKGGAFKIKGWRPMEILESKMQISPVALENVRMRFTIETNRASNRQPESYIELSGHLLAGQPLATPLQVSSSNMNFADFTDGRFAGILSAKTMVLPKSDEVSVASVSLPFAADRPIFSGVFNLKDIKITAMPALIAMLEHIEPARRKTYRPLKIEQGRVSLEHKDGQMSLSFVSDTFRQLDVVSMNGNICVNADNEVSGTLDYGIPGMLTRVEYPDGQADPLFRDEGALAWVATKVSGNSGNPTYNIEELERAADELRRDRPQRTPFDSIDVEAISEQLLKDKGIEPDNDSQSQTEPT